MFPVLLLKVIGPGTAAVWQFLSFDRKVATVVFIVFGTVIFLLNIFWFKLILKGFFRMLEKMGSNEKDSKAQ
jgi:hypothetical protein